MSKNTNMNIPAIPREKFEFANTEGKIHDKKFDDKPISYFKDAWIRFCKSRASVVAAIIIILMILFSLVCPLLITTHDKSFMDVTYAKKPARVVWMKENLGIMDGGVDSTVPETEFIRILAIGIGAESGKDGAPVSFSESMNSKYQPIIKQEYAGEFVNAKKQKVNRYDIRVDSYLVEGFIYDQVSQEVFADILEWQEETGIQVLYPMIAGNEWNPSWSSLAPNEPGDPNLWYKAVRNAGNPVSVNADGKNYTKLTFSEDMVLEENYKRDKDGNLVYMDKVASSGNNKTECRIRVLYYNYYIYKNGFEPNYIMGTEAGGYDMALRIADGLQISLIIAVAVCVINFILGALYGAVEGYYGGTLDLVLERVSDILNGVPFIVVATLFQLHLAGDLKMKLGQTLGAVVCLLFAYILTGWIGTAYRVRTQFYRFKNQEYVMAARTLGASDSRIIWKHIFPNTLGTIITSSALAIPGAIMSESMLSYLGIMKLGGPEGTSLGTILSDAQQNWTKAPHTLLYPAIVISLLMICFNLFGNGLRDAFNPSLRGVEE